MFSKLTPETRKRIGTVMEIGKTAFHWGFVPYILYLFLGFKKGAEPGMPALNVFRYVFTLQFL
ncbi:hypothetical protein CAPTEDRAFT_120988 [Capitella teleta]|uniref:Mitochondrial import receptor subunit TOM7 homolog n=1 Tax=Capitella teleta TaxID=283909 RepID=R7V9F0_CAPTE|nr:hypothetical protein CAPTEDRAFT_120988 [Capitella teleta]|eukprot:ELU15483.1 hypothetical protein CAPTEDRAFT_120988 [Capitella teleta]